MQIFRRDWAMEIIHSMYGWDKLSKGLFRDSKQSNRYQQEKKAEIRERVCVCGGETRQRERQRDTQREGG